MRTLYVCPVVSIFLLFSSPSQSSQTGCLPYFHTWFGPIANLECRSEICCTRLAGNTGRKKLPSAHHRTTLLGYIFATKALYRQSEKKLVKQQYLLQMSPRYGELRSTSGWDPFGSLGHPANFNGFRVLAVLLHGTLVVGVSQTLLRWTEGTAYSAGWPSCWAMAHVLVYFCLHYGLLAVCGHFFFVTTAPKMLH